MTGAEQPMTVGQAVMLTLHTADAYSNACLQGGDQVHVHLDGPAGSALTAATVEDFGNGAYGISFSPDAAGRWTIMPRFVGQCLPQAEHVFAQGDISTD